jgi:hypothetical protein
MIEFVTWTFSGGFWHFAGGFLVALLATSLIENVLETVLKFLGILFRGQPVTYIQNNGVANESKE